MATEFYDDDGAPIKCKHCGSTKISEVASDAMDLIVLERECICDGCGASVGYWAHGAYDPCYAENEHDQTRVEPYLPAIVRTAPEMNRALCEINDMAKRLPW